uniref:Uncharacterized protein n=1 Tax=Podoviridae sp. ctLPy3 TaxID=2825244 RepID=A0A8S5UWP2_9CAUD|nr:MAG TPA: hypothetical protein [Podoviridae sp. ctLPy3]DAR70413.1 MAG TPA: hypothetical protein [Caudoviricetes sp.]
MSLVSVSNKMCTSWNLQLHLPRGLYYTSHS